MHNCYHMDVTLILSSFQRKQGVSVELGKQLWMMPQKSLATIPVTPFCWSLLSGSGKGRKIGAYLTKKMQTSFVLPRRSKNWKEEMFAKSRLIGKDPDAEKDWRQEKGVTEDEMVGWHHQLNGHEFQQTLGDSEGQGSLVYCNPEGCKESDMTERLNDNVCTLGQNHDC